MTPGVEREILGNVPPWLLAAMYVATLGAAAAAAAKIIVQARRWRRGAPEARLQPLGSRLREVARRAVAQRDIGRDDRLARAMHRMIFWGFVVLFIATVLTSIDHQGGIPLLRGRFYLVFSFVADLFGVLFVVGVALAIGRPYLGRSSAAPWRAGDAAALGLLLVAGLTGFWVEGARIALDGWPAHERVSFAGWASGLLLAGLVPADAWQTAHRVLWAAHAAAVAGLFVIIPFTRLFHMLAAPLGIAARARSLGELREAPADPAAEPTLRLFTWKQLLELDACTSCGRCSAACPATTSGKPLSPMLLVQHLRGAMWEGRFDAPLIGSVVDPDELWSCTTCGACEDVCPVAINHIDRIVDLRRTLVERGRLEDTAARALERIGVKGNAWDAAPGERARWADGRPIRVLGEGEPCDTIYWVGCAGAYDEQARPVTLAVAALLARAGVEFGVLGSREACSGDLARRLGEEGLFCELRERNAAALRAHAPKRIITHCPHCWNAFRNEYALDGVEVVHHTTFLRQLVESGRLQPRAGTPRSVTFHDPCYLGRYNGVFDAPRALLQSLPQTEIREMPRSRERSFCCGGGGGQMLLDVKIGERVPDLRYAEARAVGATVVATACPFCKIMLAPVPAEQGDEGKVAIKDVAELLAEACA